MKEFAKMLMVLESNIKATRPCTEALTYSLIELRLNGPVNNISFMLGLLQETWRLKGPNPIQICRKSSKSRPIIKIKVKIYFNIISVMPRHSL